MSTPSNIPNIKEFIDNYKTSQVALMSKKVTRKIAPNNVGVQGRIMPAPANFSALVNDNKITLSWTTVERATSYKVERASNANFTEAVITLYNGKANSYSDTGLQPGFLYFYRVSAQAKNLTGTYAALSAETLYQLDSTSVQVDGVGENGFDLSWEAVTNATTYVAEAATTRNFGSVIELYIGGNLEVRVADLSPNTQYYIRVYGDSDGYNIKNYGTSNVTTRPILAAPATFTTSNITTSGITLTWAAVTNATGYVLERADDAIFSTNKVTRYTGSLLTFADTGLVSNKFYYYRVKATATGSTTINYATVSGTTLSS